ncbi:MAG: YihA family ribosome biogenesis GTP-binding protein [Deltaproteobacteria bacterium]|nr:YihA family ribosome biogenesis GTP-binding protein [Deltaproteobacteria bacterium]MBW2083574.1 YihA family ribosome biogenesis GTP-binding protein [Deltaproteobacteria bacterium]HDM08900.1 YihA family ribosome biogenesis GTP-binding protein [Desulfobacteraceae bacterium]
MEVSFVASAYLPDQYPPPDRPEVAFAGKSNVGKSSLLNRLVNRRHLAVTSSKPGRTRSINFFAVGRDLYFVDLPGYGYAKVPVSVKRSWKKMVETYLEGRPTLKGVVLIVDIRRDPDSNDLDLLHWLNHHGIAAVAVVTKADKLSRQKALIRASEITKRLEPLIEHKPIIFSARTGIGREELWEMIKCLIR